MRHVNETTHFQVAFASLLATYGGLFDLVSYDAGALSEANASASSTSSAPSTSRRAW